MGADGLAKPPPAPPESGLATRAAHVAREGSPLGPHGERSGSPALYQTSNYVYDDAAGAARAAGGDSYIYTRHGNPTTDALARAVAELEGAEAGLVFASGMAAVTTALIAASGDGEVLASEGIYGGTTDFLTGLAPRLGVSARFVAAWDAEAVAAAVRPETRVLLVETLSNPLLRVADISALATIARARNLTFIVDSTFATPYLLRPLTRGADLVVHSVSKYIAGHGDVVGGAVVGSRRALEPLAKVRTTLGGTMDPFAAWLALRGVRTLPLRVERQCASAARLAAALVSMPGVRKVHHPSLADHPDHARARAQLAAGGAMITIQLRDGAAARRFYDRVRVFTRAASLGDVVSLVTHPASFSHGALPPEERERLGIDEGLLRLSVGIEDVGDLEADLRQALS